MGYSSYAFFGVRLHKNHLYSGVKRHPACKHVFDLKANFCPECGKKVIEERLPSKHCGAEMETFAGFRIMTQTYGNSDHVYLACGPVLECDEYKEVDSALFPTSGCMPKPPLASNSFENEMRVSIPKEIWDEVCMTFGFHLIQRYG